MVPFLRVEVSSAGATDRTYSTRTSVAPTVTRRCPELGKMFTPSIS
jgi:hypothetical protein